MKNKVLLVTLPSELNITSFSVPLGIMSLKAIIEADKNYIVEILDFKYAIYKGDFKYMRTNNDFQSYVDHLSNYILEKKFDVIGFSSMCNNLHISLAVAKKIYQRRQNIKIFMGGPQPSFTASKILENFYYIDGICIGESELTILPFLDWLTQNKELSHIKGVCFRSEGKIINTGLPDLVTNLDDLPIIDFTYFDIQSIPTIDLDVGRGCPYSCTFCSTQLFWKRKFRLKSIDRILKEVKLLLPYNIGVFGFQHDMFTANRKYIMQFCEEIKKQRLDFTWVCSSRIDTLTEDMLRKMAEAGCTGIFIGMETGSQQMQKILNKNLRVDQLLQKVELILKYGIALTLSFIYDFPEETQEDLEETLQMIYNLYCIDIDKLKNRIQLHKLVFMNGTALFNNNKKNLSYSPEGSGWSINTWENVPNEYSQNIDLFAHNFTILSTEGKKYPFLTTFMTIIIPTFQEIFPILNLTWYGQNTKKADST